jgi:hypothetical protein
VLGFSVPAFVDRGEYAVAVSNLIKKPTAENRRIVESENVKDRREVFMTHFAAAGLLFVIINLSWSLLARRSPLNGSPS